MTRDKIEAVLQICIDNRFAVVSAGNRYEPGHILSYLRETPDDQLAQGEDSMRMLMIEISWKAEEAIQTVRQNGGVDAIPAYKAIIAACHEALRQ